jgi:undecaprenol kinase
LNRVADARYFDAVKNASFPRRLGYAFKGIATVARREKSFRTQLALAVVAAGVTAALRPGWAWAAIIGLCITAVLALELVNAALEYAIDRLHPDIHPEIRAAKDAAAGAVLLGSIGSAIVGGMMVLDVLSR